jgi:hypothetical protein
MMKDKPTARLTLLQVATQSSKLGKTKTNRKITNLSTKFVLQIGKKQEDSTILLATDKSQHKDKTKKDQQK